MINSKRKQREKKNQIYWENQLILLKLKKINILLKLVLMNLISSNIIKNKMRDGCCFAIVYLFKILKNYCKENDQTNMIHLRKGEKTN